jgi:hypothetical protein
MPLRDHFRLPLDDLISWEGFHGGWPMEIVRSLVADLPQLYIATPRVNMEGFAKPEYEVRVYEAQRGRRLVAAIELVSPANKDRPEHRRAFVAKCAALLQSQVSVTMVDLVTTRAFNLYRELLDLIGQTDPGLGNEPLPLYAVACRGTKAGNTWQMETWLHILEIGHPLPTLPLWLADNFSIPLNLEESYEETCKVLRIP